MASPVADYFGCASGGSISGGRYRITPGDYRVSIWGQSNAVGDSARSELSTSPLSSDPGLAVFEAGTFDRVYIWNGSIYTKLIPASNSGAYATKFGPEFGIAVRWMRETTTGNLFIDKEVSGGQSITYWSPAGGNYSGAKIRDAARKSWLTSNGYTAPVIGWVWVQGESDRFETQSWYQTNLQTLIDALLADAFRSGTTKLVLAKMPVGSGTYGATVSAAKDAIDAAMDVATVIQMPLYMNGDNIHLNARGQVQMSYDAFEKVFGVGHITV